MPACITTKGVLFYASPDNPGSFSKGQQSEGDGELTYYYMRNERPYPSDSQIPLALVKEAVRDFMINGGRRPGNVTWQDGTT